MVHNPNAKVILTCDHCNKNFTSRDYLSQHMLEHTQGRIHLCHLCDKGFVKVRHVCNIRGIHSSIAKDSGFLGYDTVVGLVVCDFFIFKGLRVYEAWPGDSLRYVGLLIQFVETRGDWQTKQRRCGWGMVVCGVAEMGPSVGPFEGFDS